MTADGTMKAIRVRLLTGSYFGFLGTLTSVVGNFTISVILARLLGTSGLGVYTIYSVLGVVLIPLLSLSIPSAVTRYTSQLRQKNPERLSGLLPTGFTILLAMGAVGVGVILLFVAPFAETIYSEPLLRPMLAILALSLLANITGLFAGGVLQGLEEFQSASLVGALGVAANVPVLLWLVPSFGPVGAALSGAVTAVFYAALSGYTALQALRRHGVAWSWAFSRAEARNLLKFVGPINVASFLARGSALVQNSLVAIYLGFLNLGLLRVAGVFNNAVLFFPRTLIAPLLPILTSMVSTRSPERSKDIISQLVRLALILVIPIAVGLVLALPAATEVLYGGEYAPAVPLATVLIFAAVLTFPNAIMGEQYLLATGRTLHALLVTAYSVSSGLVLVVVLLPTLGTMALPVAGLTSELTLFAILIVWLDRKNELALRALLPTTFFGICAPAAAYGLARTLPQQTAAVLALPLAVLIGALGYRFLITRDERTLLLSTLKIRKSAFAGGYR